jgi:hypothetical protein
VALEKLLDDDVYTSVTAIAEAEDIGKSYVSRILRSRCWRPTSWMRIWPDARIRRWCWRGWSGRCRRAEEQRARILEPKTSSAV